MPLFLMFQAYYEEMLKKYEAPKVGAFALVLVGILVTTIYMVGQTQDPRQRAAEPDTNIYACPTPPACRPGEILEEDYFDEANACTIYRCSSN